MYIYLSSFCFQLLNVSARYSYTCTCHRVCSVRCCRCALMKISLFKIRSSLEMEKQTTSPLLAHRNPLELLLTQLRAERTDTIIITINLDADCMRRQLRWVCLGTTPTKHTRAVWALEKNIYKPWGLEKLLK